MMHHKTIKKIQEVFNEAYNKFIGVLTESELEKRTYYKKLKNSSKDLNASEKIGKFKKEIRMLKLAKQAEADVNPRALNGLSDEDIAEINNWRANQTPEAIEQNIENIKKQMQDVTNKQKNLAPKLSIAATVKKLEPARLELVEILGSERQANFVITLYAAMIENKFFSSGKKLSGYEKDFYLELVGDTPDYDQEKLMSDALATLRNPELAKNHPKLIRAWVNHTLESDEMHKTWNLDIANRQHGIVANLKNVDEKEGGSIEGTDLSSFPQAEHIVGSDANWVTYHQPTSALGYKMKTQHIKHLFKDDPRYHSNEAGQYLSTWCTTSKDYEGNFNSYKNSTNDDNAEWFMTLSRNNIHDRILDYLEARNDLRVSREEFNEYAKDNGFWRAIDAHSGVSKGTLKDKFIGEVYLRSTTPRTQYRQVGPHKFSNPGTPSGNSYLEPKMSYGYGGEDLKISGGNDFETERGVLVAYKGSEPIVVVPQGINSIGPNAFKDNTTVVQVVLPYSVATIKKKAFVGCTSLKLLRVTHNLSSVSRSAFQGLSGVQLGVVTKDENGDQYLDKPKSLDWYPKELDVPAETDEDLIDEMLLDELDEDDLAVARDYQQAIDDEQLNETFSMNLGTRFNEASNFLGEAKVDLRNVNYVPRKRNLYDHGPSTSEGANIYYVEDGEIYFNKELSGKIIAQDLNVPERVVTMGTRFYGSFGVVTFPKSFRDFPNDVLEEEGSIFGLCRFSMLDLSKTAIQMIHEKTFGHLTLKEGLKLPNKLRVLGGWRNTHGALADVTMRELHFNVKNLVDIEMLASHNQHNTTLQGLTKPFFRKLHTDEPEFFELMSGNLTDIAKIPVGSRAAEVVDKQAAHYNKDVSEIGAEFILEYCTNPYIATNRFRTRVQILKKGA